MVGASWKPPGGWAGEAVGAASPVLEKVVREVLGPRALSYPAPRLFLATCPLPPRMHCLGLIITMAILGVKSRELLLWSLPAEVIKISGELAVPPPGSQPPLTQAGTITSCPTFDTSRVGGAGRGSKGGAEGQSSSSSYPPSAFSSYPGVADSRLYPYAQHYRAHHHTRRPLQACGHPLLAPHCPECPAQCRSGGLARDPYCRSWREGGRGRAQVMVTGHSGQVVTM